MAGLLAGTASLSTHQASNYWQLQTSVHSRHRASRCGVTLASTSRGKRSAVSASAVATRPDAQGALLAELAEVRQNSSGMSPASINTTSSLFPHFVGVIYKDARLASLNFRPLGSRPRPHVTSTTTPRSKEIESSERAVRRLQRRAAAVSTAAVSAGAVANGDSTATTTPTPGRAALMNRRRRERCGGGGRGVRVMAAATAVGGISKEVLFLPGGTEGEQLLSFLQHRTTAKLPTEIQTLCCNIIRTASSLQHSKHRDDFLVEVAAIAENALLTSNEQLIAKLAWDVSKGDPHLYQHLIAEAHKQLPVAAANYRPDNGASFVTYFYRCAWAVMKRLQGYQGDVLHLPDRTRNRLRQVQREQVNVVEEEGREPSSRRLAETCGLKEADVRDMQTYQRMKQLSYETTIAVDESRAGTELTDSTEGGGELSALPQREINGLLRDAMGSLSDTERSVIELMYGLREGEDGKRHTVAAVSRSVGLSRQSVYKAEQRALDKLREYLREVCGGEAQLLLQSGL